MTQITTTTQPGDVVVIVPGWIIRVVGFLSLFIGLSTALLLVMIGHVEWGALIAVIMLALVPIGLLIQYVVWRFYWYLALVVLIFQSLCYVLTLVGATGFMARLPASVSNSPLGPTAAELSSANPAGALIAFLVAALITATLYRFYTLWWRGEARPKPKARPSDPEAVYAGESSFDFDTPATNIDGSLMGRVLRKLEATGSRGEVKGNTIHVYKGSRFVGIVRVIESDGAISPVILNDVIKQRDRLGAKVAYLATSGMFTAAVRNMADAQGIKLMTV